MSRVARLLLALLALAPAAAGAATAAQTREELRELRARIVDLQKKLAASEETRAEVSDALRDSERAISEANRELRQLNRQSRETRARLDALRKSARETGQAVREQQERLVQMLRRQYMQGQSDTLRLVLSRENPSEMARQLHYLAQIASARAQWLKGLRANLDQIERLQSQIAEEAAAIAHLAAGQAAQRAKLEKEKRARAEVLQRVSRDIRAQQKEMRAMQANENRLTRLFDQLARMVRKPPGKRPRTESVPSASSDGRPFDALRGQLALPVRGELGNRFGSPREGGGITWKGLFIAARSGEDIRAVAGGRVVYADWLRGFGNLLIIDHGDSYMTLYAYAEALLKQLGDVIRGGETVATVGNSGGNPESGLYFEMRHEGRPFDPLDWVRLR